MKKERRSENDHSLYWKVREGYHVPESEMNRQESEMVWNGAVDGRYRIQPTLPWKHTTMEPDLIYALSPESKDWKPDPSQKKPEEPKQKHPHVVHGVQSALHPMNFVRMPPLK